VLCLQVALEGLPLYAIMILRTDLFAILAADGYIAIYKESDNRNSSSRRNANSERFVQNRVVTTKDRSWDILGGALSSGGKRMAIFTRGYIGSLYCENLPMKRVGR